MNKKDISKLKKILNKKTSKFENYQEIPEFILNKLLKESSKIKYKQTIIFRQSKIKFFNFKFKIFFRKSFGSRIKYRLLCF
tara:strand:+ start:334 stop:576 length:243 start_codon:yes stop_codon:yes gene_type:complete